MLKGEERDHFVGDALGYGEINWLSRRKQRLRHAHAHNGNWPAGWFNSLFRFQDFLRHSKGNPLLSIVIVCHVTPNTREPRL